MGEPQLNRFTQIYRPITYIKTYDTHTNLDRLDPVRSAGTLRSLSAGVRYCVQILSCAPLSGSGQIAPHRRLLPGLPEDKVIIDSVRSFLEQDYPKEMYDVYVISDHMQDSTNKALSRLPIRLLVATYEDSSKAKALLLAISTIEEDGKAKGLGNRQLAFMYDIAVVMDADNVTVPGFLSEVNRAYSAGVQAMQAHRTGKNLNTDIALLDGVSEEINNGFFRSGHNALGLSAGLAGSGMAFDYFWYYDAVQSLETAGEDKELELTLLECRMHTVYLENLPVYDEKTQKKENIKNQRRRWMAAQFDLV